MPESVAPAIAEHLVKVGVLDPGFVNKSAVNPLTQVVSHMDGVSPVPQIIDAWHASGVPPQ